MGLLVSSSNANFYENQYITKGQNILAAFDIDRSFQMDLDLFEMHHRKTKGEKWESFLESFDKGYTYIPILKQMLNDAGVPQEFLYLAMAESEFSPRAYSPKKASGIWQIMPKTGRQLGLRIDEFIDERRDPIKSTEAAIKYLKSLYNATGKWYLAAMAYNCGIGRLQKAIKEAGSDDIYVLMDEQKKYIPSETRNYIRMIISMGIAFNDINTLKTEEKEYFLNRGAALTLASIKLPAGTSLESISKGAGMDLKELQQYNRQFKYNFLPPIKGEYDVYLPYDYLLDFKQNFKPKKIDLENYFIVYRVKKGDSLYSISRKYGISIATLKNANNLNKTLLSINQKLIVPLMQSKYKIANNAFRGK
ncbi:hypothetical protein CCY99_02635 [Helicobacter sp. 16-1353]|nr:hypothetical protein CCY99_02635 [Helicobacter sp. 16-1353]